MLMGRFPGQALVAVCFFVAFLYWFFQPDQAVPGSSSLRPPRRSGQSLLDDINNSTLGFGRIYIINLPSRTDRKDALTLMSKVTDLQLAYIDAHEGKTILDKALPPPGKEEAGHLIGNVGSWRSHLDVIRAVVENDLETALVLEDDVDWDVRIKQQMSDYAATIRALLQPLASSPSSYADPTFLNPEDVAGQPQELSFKTLPRTVPPQISPYGDNWDVLWLGHCGTEAPNVNYEDDAKRKLSRTLARGRVIHYNDETVPENEWLKIMDQEYDPRLILPNHSRVTHHVMGQICSLGYAVSQRGARRILYEMGVKKFDVPFDIMLRDICEGVNGRPKGAVCMTVEPQLFQHHRPVGLSKYISDISNHADEEPIEKPSTDNIRWSVRMNLPHLVLGETTMDDQYPDQNEA